MKEKKQLLKEIEQAPDYLIKEVLNFLLLTKNKNKKQDNQVSLEKQLVRIQVEERGMREGIAKSQEWAEIASRKKAIAERA